MEKGKAAATKGKRESRRTHMFQEFDSPSTVCVRASETKRFPGWGRKLFPPTSDELVVGFWALGSSLQL